MSDIIRDQIVAAAKTTNWRLEEDLRKDLKRQLRLEAKRAIGTTSNDNNYQPVRSKSGIYSAMAVTVAVTATALIAAAGLYAASPEVRQAVNSATGSAPQYGAPSP